MSGKKVIFSNKLTGEVLAAVSAEETDISEIRAMVESLAYKNGLDVTKIVTKVE